MSKLCLLSVKYKLLHVMNLSHKYYKNPFVNLTYLVNFDWELFLSLLQYFMRFARKKSWKAACNLVKDLNFK